MRITVLTATHPARQNAFTLVEVVMSVFIMMLVFSGIITCYIQNAYRAEWSGYSLAAQSAACQVLEKAKGATWDVAAGKDEIASLPTNYVSTLDLPISGTNSVTVVCTV